MNPLQDKIKELDVEIQQLKKEAEINARTLTVIRVYLKNVPAEIKAFELVHDLTDILNKNKILLK